MPGMTPPDGQADGTQGNGEDWESRYTGLQRVVSKRDQETAALRRQMDEIVAARESDATELAEYRAQRAAAEEEARALASYESLRDRFEEEPPAPLRHNEARPGKAPKGPGAFDSAWPT